MKVLKYAIALIAAAVAVTMNFKAKKISERIKGDESLMLRFKIAAAGLCVADFIYVMIFF